MKRLVYFEVIERKLSSLGYRIGLLGKINLLNIHNHAEDFYSRFLNEVFGWKLKNLNAKLQNAAGIDLIDTPNKFAVQVSATATKHKVESALAKKTLATYKGFSFKFLSLCQDADGIRSKTFANPHGLIFNPKTDIYDIASLLRHIKELEVGHQQRIAEFLQNELSDDPDPTKMESNLATIIKILAKADLTEKPAPLETIPFNIEDKITHNKLVRAATLIEEHKIHYPRIVKIYSGFDAQGANKSLSILNAIRTVYVAIDSNLSPDDCFFAIVSQVVRKIKSSSNYTPLPEEELELCVQILVVDTFIRCKIFKNPARITPAHS